MAGVWAVLTLLTIFVGLPAILGTYLAAEYGGTRLVHVWLTAIAAILVVSLALTGAVMFSL